MVSCHPNSTVAVDTTVDEPLAAVVRNIFVDVVDMKTTPKVGTAKRMAAVVAVEIGVDVVAEAAVALQ